MALLCYQFRLFQNAYFNSSWSKYTVYSSTTALLNCPVTQHNSEENKVVSYEFTRKMPERQSRRDTAWWDQNQTETRQDPTRLNRDPDDQDQDEPETPNRCLKMARDSRHSLESYTSLMIFEMIKDGFGNGNLSKKQLQKQSTLMRPRQDQVETRPYSVRARWDQDFVFTPWDQDETKTSKTCLKTYRDWRQSQELHHWWFSKLKGWIWKWKLKQKATANAKYLDENHTRPYLVRPR